jgi:hypothetical protein
MGLRKLVTEAERCRSLAHSYDGRPEQPFLLKVAAVFDELARQESTQQSSYQSSR